ncbi:cobalamin biosynthesis protein, partial [Saccharomonospora iraqiensis]|uniref:cobalamin biosynthesis protein n=1 Tax=Saccharomonospora iraqiensis TaxID=52698 RepID=UPI00048B2721
MHVVGTASATWAALGAARMVREGSALARCLETGDADAAPALPAGSGSRHVGDLPDPEPARASVEKVAADTVDSVVTPLLWGAVAGVPGLLGARAVNRERARIVGGTAPAAAGSPHPTGAGGYSTWTVPSPCSRH